MTKYTLTFVSLCKNAAVKEAKLVIVFLEYKVESL